MNKNYIKPFIAILIAGFLGAIQGTFVKIAVREIPPFSFTFIRFFLASIIMLPFFLKEKFLLKKGLVIMFLISLLGTVNVVFYAFGVRLTDVNIGAVLYTAVPIITAILSFLVLQENLNVRKITGILFGFIGTLFIIFLPFINKTLIYKGNFIGNLLIFIGVLSFSFYSVLSKKNYFKYSPLGLTTLLMITSAFTTSIFTLVDIKTQPGWWSLVTVTGIISTLLVVLSTVGFYFLYQYAIKHGTPLIASMSLYIQPVATFILAGFFLGERLTLIFIIGAVLTFIGAWMVTMRKY